MGGYMKRYQTVLALAVCSVMALSMFAACGETDDKPDDGVQDNAVTRRICYDNLGGGYLSEADTKVAVAGAKSIKGYDAYGQAVSDYSTIATYTNGVFTAKSAGTIVYEGKDGEGRLQVVPAYVTDPGNQYKGNRNEDTSLTNGAAYLGHTHDPSFLEVETQGGSVYYLFSTGWGTGNDVHVSYDGMLTWEYSGKTTVTKDYSNAAIFPEDLKTWMNSTNNSGDIQWWAPDIVEAKDGGYWFYTCLVMADDRMPYLSPTTADTPGNVRYSRACIVMYHISDLSTIGEGNTLEYKGVLMQSAIPQNGLGGIDINGIDPQIIYDTDGKMYMSYGSFGTGNWMIELDPETGLRKDGDNEFHDWEWIRDQRNTVVSGSADNTGTTDFTKTHVYKEFTQNGKFEHDYYGKMISLGAMEAPIIARHDNVKIADETAEYGADGEPAGVTAKTYYYSMHSYNGLSDNYQMWGGRSESVWGQYKSVGGGIVYNVNIGVDANEGNKYMGGFKWRDESKVEGCKEINIVLPGHNDLYTANNGAHYAAYITRTFDYGTEEHPVQIHQYYLNSMGDICINPNRFGGEIDRSVSKEELLHYTDGGKFEMVVLTNSADWSKATKEIKNVSFEVVLGEDGTVTRDGSAIGNWTMYGKGYIKFTFNETLKGTGSYDSGETVYYGVVRPAWLGNRNQSGFTISCMGHSGEKQNMAMFMNSYSTIG